MRQQQIKEQGEIFTITVEQTSTLLPQSFIGSSSQKISKDIVDLNNIIN